jgi:putative transposase
MDGAGSGHLKASTQEAMRFDLERPDRKSIRLKNYDYTRSGAYFVTVCVRKRLCLFGHVVDGEMVLNEFGTIVRDEWLKTAEIRDNIELDGFVVMPNHVHGIVLITSGRGTARRAPTTVGLGTSDGKLGDWVICATHCR